MANPMTFTRRSFLVMPLALAACKGAARVLELSGLTMGTSYNVIAVDGSRSIDERELKGAVEAALAQVNKQMSNWDAGSEIARFNAGGTGQMSISPEFAKVMAAADSVHTASGGKFDVTVGPLIDLWGFGAKGHVDHVPTDEAIAQALAISGQSKSLSVGAGALTKHNADAQIYLSSIAKGYGVDLVAEAVKSFGINDFMVEIGGDLVTSGKNPDGMAWQIGIEAPIPGVREIQEVVGVSGRGMASSGDYRNFFEDGGQRYSHIIDPATGRPITHETVATTVLADNAMLADAWSTAMLILGREKGLEIAESLDLAVLFIDRDRATTASSAYAALRA